MAKRAVGIDLGTTNSVVAAVIDGVPQVILSASGATIHPSVVSMLPDGQVLVGERAIERMALAPGETIFSAKRLLGLSFTSPVVQKAALRLPYKLVQGANDQILVEVHQQNYSISEISAMVLTYLKKTAEARLGCTVDAAVITVPAHFNDNQRQATKAAARIAGLDPLRILNEPTAAAISYGLGKGIHRKVAVYDMGGGTFDLSILDIDGEVFEVVATAGDTYLGGNDFDSAIVEDLRREALEDFGIDLIQIGLEQRLRRIAEEVKIRLSVEKEVVFKLDIDGEGAARQIDFHLDQSRITEVCKNLIQRSLGICEHALKRAGLQPSDIDDVICVGGQTQMPLVTRAVHQYFGTSPKVGINPMEVVGVGAAILADQLTASIDDGLRSFFGAGGPGGLPGLPGQKPMLPSPTAFDLEDTDGLDNALAGLAPSTPAQPPKPAKPRAVLLDITPMTLRLATAGGFTTPVIEKNTPIPYEQVRVFATAKEHQTEVAIRVYQGEAPRASQNECLGSFAFSGLEVSSGGRAEVEVTFAIDADGILNVSARDPISGVQKSANIDFASRLSESEIQALAQRSAVNQRIQI